MFINKASDGKNNICGSAIATRRREMGISQRELADRLQIIGLDVDKNAVQRMESGQRFITDIELVHLAQALDLPIQELFVPTRGGASSQQARRTYLPSRVHKMKHS